MKNPVNILVAVLRWCRRKWWKLLLGGAGVMVLLFGIAVYGLRYGFVPLPKPPPGFTLPYPPPGTVAFEEATHGWAPVREMDLTPLRRYRLDPVPLALGGPVTVHDWGGGDGDDTWDEGVSVDWSTYDPRTTEVRVSSFSQLHDLIDDAASNPAELTDLGELLRHSDEFMSVLAPSQRDIDYLGERFCEVSDFALVLGGRSLERAQMKESLEYATTVFTLGAAGWLLGNGFEGYERAALDFITLVCLSGGALDREAGIRQLGALKEVANLLPSVEASYVASVWRALPQQDDPRMEDYLWRYQRWGDWGEDVLHDLESACRQLPELGEALWLRILGEGRDDNLFDIIGLDVLEWVSRGWFTLAVQVSRPADRERVLLAGAGEGLARLRVSGDRSYHELARFERAAKEGFVPAWWMYVSQPVALACFLNRPSRAVHVREREWFLWRLETARLLLALRLRRDAIGHWPDSLDELVPEYLDRLPLDTLHARPFLYRRQGAHWVLWLEDREGHEPNNWEFNGTAFWSARCMLRGQRQSWDWQLCLKLVGSEGFFRDTPDLNDLLALLPPGSEDLEPITETSSMYAEAASRRARWEESLEPSTEPFSMGLDELMMRRYGLLPPEPWPWTGQ